MSNKELDDEYDDDEEEDLEGTLVRETVRTPPNAEALGGTPSLITLHPTGPDLGRRQPLDRDEYVLGRVAEADIVVERDSVSRRHSRLFSNDKGWFIEDLASTNGTFVNEVKITKRRLRDGDQIRVGDVIYKFLTGANLESAYHEEVYRMTILDGLTGIHNKRYFLEFLEREVARSQRHHHPLTLVLFDIDHFKQINDKRGHLTGDAVLRQLADRLRHRIRREDLLARYGGEEFAVVLSVTGLAGGVLFAEDVRLRVADTPFVVGGERVPVTVSLGVAGIEADDGDTGAGELIARADEKLYQAKKNGRNRVES